MVLARRCGLTGVAACLAGFLSIAAAALRARLRELYLPADARKGSARSGFDYTRRFGPLLRWAAGGQPQQRLALALGPTCLTDRFRVLCASVLYQGAGLPVAWAAQTADQKGAWNDIWRDLPGRLKEASGEGCRVLALTDRGPESATPFRAVTDPGWHPLMRAKAAGTFRPRGWHQGYAVGAFAPEPGRRFAATGVAYPSGERPGCALSACRGPGHGEARLLLTELPVRGADPAWHAWRVWAELGSRAIKRGQWQWQRTRMTDPWRAARLWAVTALATLWAIDVGAEAEAAAVPELPAVRGMSPLERGLLLLSWALWRGEPLPTPRHRLPPHDGPPRSWEGDPRTEERMEQG